jgi:methylated-DNA-[protein]-cysteine S-methyltransferase
MKTISWQTIETPWGPCVAAASSKGLVYLTLPGDSSEASLKALAKRSDVQLAREENPLLKKTARQLREYFDGRRTTFDVPLDLLGTDFQKKVWRTLRTVEYGETVTYKDVAIKTGNPNASRAIGMANQKNPVPIIVPCHRVIGKDGAMVGYAGGLPMKRRLLSLESSATRRRPNPTA